MDRVRKGVYLTQAMILVCSFLIMAVIYFLGKYMVLIFVDPSETDVIDAAQVYFNTVAWCYPFLGSIYLYRNALQGLGYGLVPMLGGVFELIARWGDRGPGGRKRRFREPYVCLTRPPGSLCADTADPLLFLDYEEREEERGRIKEGAVP